MRASFVAPRRAVPGIWRHGLGAVVWVALCGMWLAPIAFANPLPFSDREDGISCPFYDVKVGAGWPSGKPEGADVDGKLNGARPFATDRLEASDTRRVRRPDVTGLVRGWWQGQRDNDGLLLRVVAGDMLIFHARKTADPSLRPQLLLHGADDKQ